ncbi:HAMP domain-containing protein [Breoghania sp.]|uniref:HAMP domain-containing protein n=1 Tax=Breoghania sp. TaxID=2065378 RepID=UPI002615E2DC|nr:HAMP domain-containing protein [Breoghania sp.]MDJ0931842.1 hypothetical protein [Breoghania sp.]
MSGLMEQISTFAGQVALTFSVFGIGLIGAVLLQVWIGTRPLKRLRASFAAVRRGDAEKIDENLPSELAPLALELNALIASNKETVERARGHVGNLARGLKTPLSVITNEARAAHGPLPTRFPNRPRSCACRSSTTWNAPAWPRSAGWSASPPKSRRLPRA